MNNFFLLERLILMLWKLSLPTCYQGYQESYYQDLESICREYGDPELED